MKNAESYVHDALKSLLAQTFKEFEIIVVDDGSTDASREIVEGFTDKRIKIISGKGTGIADAFNLALKITEGKYICNCDADDLFPPDRLSWQVEWLEKNQDYSAVCGTYSPMAVNGDVLGQYHCGEKSENISVELLSGITRTHWCTFLTRQRVLLELEGCRRYFVTAQDIDFQLRLVNNNNNVWYEPINTYFYRLHNNSITHEQGTNTRIFYENIAREFSRQRIEEGVDLLQKGMAPVPPKDDKNPLNSSDQIVNYLIAESWRLHYRKNKFSAFVLSMKACIGQPLSWSAWKNMIMVLVK